MMNAALAIFVKTAGLSPVKTRLARDLGNEIAEQFYHLSIQAVAAVVRSTPSVFPSFWAVAEHEGLASDQWQSLPSIWQGEGDLGLRMHRMYKQLQSRYGRAILIGADVPQISAALLNRAVTDLAGSNAAYTVGNTRDGGFWLFGGNAPVPKSVWLSTPYSDPDTRGILVKTLGAQRVCQLPLITDVDESFDLPFLCAELDELRDRLPEQQRLAAWLQLLMGDTKP